RRHPHGPAHLEGALMKRTGPTHGHTTATAREPLPHRGRAIGLGIGLPLAIIAATYALVLTWLPDLPETVALHWGPNGVDRTGSVTQLVTVSSALIGIAVVVLFPMVLLLGRSALSRRM